MQASRLLLACVVASALAVATAVAEEKAEKKAEVTGPYRVAVLPFEAQAEEGEKSTELGSQVADLLTAML